MTITACHVCSEGVILGADSMTTISTGGVPKYHFDHAQKIFEVGKPHSLLALATWGGGSFGITSHRRIAHQLGLLKEKNPDKNLKELSLDLQGMARQAFANRIPAGVWTNRLNRFKELLMKFRSDPQQIDAVELDELVKLHENNLGGGYFLAGRGSVDSPCEAYEIEWGMMAECDKPIPEKLDPTVPHFRGMPFIMQRLLFGYDPQIVPKIIASGKWSGTDKELHALCASEALTIDSEFFPLRDAIDWIHTVIHTTSRAVKFSGEIGCGGQPEIAVVTCDRPFRWVCHKPLDMAMDIVKV